MTCEHNFERACPHCLEGEVTALEAECERQRQRAKLAETAATAYLAGLQGAIDRIDILQDRVDTAERERDEALAHAELACLEIASLRAEIERLTRERDEARAWLQADEKSKAILSYSQAHVVKLLDRAHMEERSAIGATSERYRKALEEAQEYMRSNIPANGWGLLDHGADADRMAVLVNIRAALADPQPPEET